MRSNQFSQLCAVCGILAVNLLLASPTWAQRGGEPSRLELLEREEIQSDLQLSPEQLAKLAELRESLNDRSEFRDLMRKASEAESEEQKAQIREQMKNYGVTRRQGADEKLKEVLTETQITRLGQLVVQVQGLRALTTDDVTETLKLTDEQQQQVAALVEEQQIARRELGFGATDEQRQQFRAEWDRKVMVVLTAEQRQQWVTMTGPPIGQGASPVASATPAQAPATQQPQTEYSPQPAVEVLSSFGAPATVGDDDSGRPAVPGDGRLYFTFRDAPWADVLIKFADAADLTLDLINTPPGTFGYFDNEGYTVTEALDIINGYLLARGYILIRRDKFLVCVNIDDPIPPNLVPTVTVDELPNRGRNELMRVAFPLPEVEDINALAEAVEELKGPQGTVTGITPTKSLVVIDIGENLLNIRNLLEGSGPQGDLVFKAYALQYVFADDAEFIVRSLLGLSTDDGAAAAAASSAASEAERARQERIARFSRFGGGDRGGFGGDRSRTPTRAPTASGSTNRSASKANTIADPRTNKLFVTATLQEHKIVEEALVMFDVSEQSPLSSDRPFGGLGDKSMTVIALANMDPTSAALMLQSMFSKEGDEAPAISADLLGRQLIIRGSEAQIYSIRQLLADMGEDGTGASNTERGPVRSINLGGRDASELLPILERMWKAQHGPTIRVVTPEARDEASRRRNQILRDLNEQRGNAPDRTRRPQRPGGARGSTSNDDDRAAVDPVASRGELFAVSAETESDPGSADSQAPAGSSLGGVTIQQFGDELMIIADDQETADAVEQMLERIMQTIPPRTTWSIFPLTSADATEASLMLQQLFPDSQVSQASSSSSGTLGALTNSISSFGSGVADLTGLSQLGVGPQTLKIIPEIRLNALFVAGPAYKVQEVEDMLTIIDSTGLTDTNRDRVPRLIPVEFADIDDVHEIVSSVYAPEMQAPNNNRGGGDPRQAFAGLFGGGGRTSRGGSNNGGGNSGGNGQSQEPEVTLGIDRDTSHLIVSASDATFVEIEELVYSIDMAAQKANRTIMVRELVNTNAATIQGSLSSIMPKVTVSTSTSSGRPSTSSSSSSRPQSGPTDEQRAAFIQRMRESGGFGRGGFGGGGGPGGGGFGRGGGGFSRGGGGRPGGGGGPISSGGRGR